MEEYCQYQIEGYVENTYEEPLTIVSGEIPQLNKKVVFPGAKIAFRILIPQGYREYIYEYLGPKKAPHIYVGWIDESVGVLSSEL